MIICALDCKVARMRAVFVIIVAVVVSFAVAASADDRPSDPFGDHTIELKEGPLVEIWSAVRDELADDQLRTQSCVEFSKDPCPSVSTFVKIVDEARENDGKALLGHLNRSINLMIKPAPGDWTGPLETMKLGNGDCKAYSIAKYAAALEAGISPDRVRIVIVHNQQRHEDHMVTAIYENTRWLILDSLTMLLLQDSEKTDYEPLAVLDQTGVRSYLLASF
jgi:predicted transglutaminase-like cysteine proteinase